MYRSRYSPRQFEALACQAFADAVARDELVALMESEGYPAEQCIREIRAGLPVHVVKARYAQAAQRTVAARRRTALSNAMCRAFR